METPQRTAPLFNLAGLAGPLAGSSYPIGANGLTLGRHSSNDVRVPDGGVSRFHCRIELEDGLLYVVDLGSQHGTFVNGEQVERRRIEVGDELSVLTARFVVRERELGDSPPSTAIELPLEEGFYRQPDRFFSNARGQVGVREAVLLRASQAIGDLRDVDALIDRLLELVLQAAPASERAALLIHDRSGEERLRFMRPGQEGTSVSEELSRTIVNRVLSERVALVVEDLEESATQVSDSLLAQEVKSLVGVPLLDLHDRAMGLLYLDASTQAAEMERGQLEFLTAFAGLASTALSNLLEFERLESERRRLHQLSVSSEMVGASESIARVRKLIDRVARSDTTVLLLGESGTGKEVAAKALHRASQRADRPFVVLNCAALPETLLESELFGHEKGAFTGADRQKRGRLEAADSGTLFLDEIGEMAPALQAKLLRVLEQRTFERLGGDRSIDVDIRVLAATHRDLRKEIEAGNFRQDLFYRLNVVSITLPPLRERGKDVMLLADHFRTLHAGRVGRSVVGFSHEARRVLEVWQWPGNVRELSNAIERAVVLSEDDRIDVHDLPEELAESPALAQGGGSYHETLRETKRRLIKGAVVKAQGRYVEAAKALDLHPNYLHRLIKNLDLKKELEQLLKDPGAR